MEIYPPLPIPPPFVSQRRPRWREDRSRWLSYASAAGVGRGARAEDAEIYGWHVLVV